MSITESNSTSSNTGILSRLMKEATVLNRSFNLYLVAFSTIIFAILTLLDKLNLAKHFGGGGIAVFYILMSIPVLLVFLTDTLPKILQKRREQLLIQTGLQGQVKRSHYFRLEPYQAEDQAQFYRADQAQQKVLTWIMQSTAPLL
jgi:hypothetical protein